MTKFMAAMVLSMMPHISQPASPVDLVIKNARIWTATKRAEQPQALAVRGDRIIAVGNNNDMAAHVVPGTLVIDAGGRRVIPGLVDCHAHIIPGGLQLERLHLRDVADREAFIRAIGDAAKQAKPGEWLLGGRWSSESWPDPTPPTREWIDGVTGDVPVLLSRMDGHQALVNSAALRIAGIDASRPTDPAGGEIERDPATNEPTGILKDAATELVAKHIPQPTDAQLDAALIRAMRHANSLGLTGLHDMSEPEHLASFDRVRARGEATLRIRSFISANTWRDHYAAAQSFHNDEWVTVAGFKGYMDGSMGSRTAYMHEPYSDAAANWKNPTGLLSSAATPAERMLDQIIDADARGFQLVVHAIGDKANTLLLDFFADAARRNPPRDRRHRSEHAQHLTARDIDRFDSLGVIASMQPYHKADDARYAEAAIGLQRCRTSYAYHDLLDAGAKLAFGSDWPVVTLNPLAGLAVAVNARTLDGKTWMPHQSITVDQALRAYTTDAAYAGFSEKDLGTIEVGKLADLVILNRDPFTIDALELDKIKPTHTIVGGKLVWTTADSHHTP